MSDLVEIQDQYLPGVMWRSIDTAPKDGTVVLLWGDERLSHLDIEECDIGRSYCLARWDDTECVWLSEYNHGWVYSPTAWAPLTPPERELICLE